MGRGYMPELSIETHIKLLNIQQVGGAGRIVAGVPVFSSDLNQVGTGFFGDLWSGFKSFFAPIGRTLLKSAGDLLGDAITPGTDLKEAGIKRFHEAGSQLLDQGVEALRRRTQRGSGRGRKRGRAREIDSDIDTMMSGQGCRSLSYIPCPKRRKRSVSVKRKSRKQGGRVQKKRKARSVKRTVQQQKKKQARKTRKRRSAKRKAPATKQRRRRKQAGAGYLGF